MTFIIEVPGKVMTVNVKVTCGACSGGANTHLTDPQQRSGKAIRLNDKTVTLAFGGQKWRGRLYLAALGGGCAGQQKRSV
jgi:hypothetical protein